MIIFVAGVICIVASFAIRDDSVTGGAKKQPTVTITVGEKNDQAGYNAQFRFTIMRNDEYIRPVLERGYLFDKYNVIAAWPYATGTVIDVGANIGTFCVPVSRVATDVIAFEPQTRIYKLLMHNIKQNSCGNIQAHHAAAGHTTMTTHMSGTVADGESAGKSIDSSGLVNYGGIQLGQGGERCDMVTIDSLDRDVSLIKVDVEGAEPMVFYGAQKTIQQSKPVLLFEKNFKTVTADMIRDMNLDNEHNFDIFSYARECGYDTLVLLPTDNYMLIHPSRFIASEHYEPTRAVDGFKTFRFKKIKWS